MKKYCLTLSLLCCSLSAAALDVRPLKDKPPTVVEELPMPAPKASQQPEKKSLVEHLQQSSQTPQAVPSGPPTSLPPSGKLPPLPPSMTAPSGKWSELPPLPDGTQITAPPRSSGSSKQRGSKAAPKPAAPDTDYKAKFGQCVTEVQQQYSGLPTKLLRNDNQVYSITVIEGGQRKVVTCSTTKGKIVE